MLMFAETAIVHGFVLEDEVASVTRAVNGNVPGCVGVPVTAPAADSVRPAGSCPVETEYEYGNCPPEAVNADEYAWPVMAAAAGQDPIARPEVTAMESG